LRLVKLNVQVFQRRKDNTADFDEDWGKYKDGIKKPDDPNFWLGT